MAKDKSKWITIVAKDFGNASLGETLGDNIIGRKIVVNLMNVLNEPKKQNANLIFKIKNIEDDKAVAELLGYRVLLSYVKRVMRVGVDKMEDSFIFECKDGKLKIKPYVLVRNKVQKGVLTTIRKETKEFLEKELKDKNIKDVMDSIINSSMQIKLRKILNKIYPIVFCEFRIVEKI